MMRKLSSTHIGIDGNEANVTNRVGSNVYAYHLLKAIAEEVGQQPNLTVTVFLSQPPLADMPTAAERWQYVVLPSLPLATFWLWPWLLLRHHLSVFFSPGHYLPAWLPVPMVNTVMDLGYEHFPKQFKRKDLWQLRFFTRWAVARARAVFTISQATLADVAAVYGKSSQALHIAYPGQLPLPEVSESQQSEVLRHFGLHASEYLLYVGTLQPRKNIVRLVEAFEQLADEFSTLNLVLAGRAGWLSQPILERIEQSPRRERIIQTGFITDVQKVALIRGARALVLIGLYEGFGIPPLEAIQLGTLPVVSQTASLPEVVGESGIVVDPNDISSIVSGLRTALTVSPSDRTEMVQHLQQHAMQFSWQRSAQSVLQVLILLAQERSRA